MKRPLIRIDNPPYHTDYTPDIPGPGEPHWRPTHRALLTLYAAVGLALIIIGIWGAAL